MKISRFQKSLLCIYQPELTTSKQQLTERFPYSQVVSIQIEVSEPTTVPLNMLFNTLLSEICSFFYFEVRIGLSQNSDLNTVDSHRTKQNGYHLVHYDVNFMKI